MLLPGAAASEGQASPVWTGMVISAVGPGGNAIAAWLADQTAEWADCGRPGAQELELRVWPASAGPKPATRFAQILQRPSVTIEASWR